MREQASLNFEQKHDDPIRDAKRALVSAEVLDRSNDPGTNDAFDEAENLAISCADQEQQMLTFTASGWFHERRGATSIAREKYSIALDTAECLAVVSDEAADHKARLKWDLVRLDNRENSTFGNLLKASKRADSPDHLRKTWDRFVADCGNSQGRRAARGFGSVEYFRERLDVATSTPSDDEDEDIGW
jgi:hypothetical protein